MGYKDVNELYLVYTHRGFFRGAYGEHESLQYIHKKLKNDDHTLKSYESSLEFSKQMTKQFTNNDVYKDGKMISLKNHQFSRSSRGPAGSFLSNMNFCLNTSKPTQEDFDALMQVTNCPSYKLPKIHPDNHFLSKCTLAKKYEYTHPYNQTSDETWADFKKKQAQRKTTADADKKDADDLKKAGNDRKAQAGCEKADAEKVRLADATAAAGATEDDTVVGKGGKDTITEKEKADAIKANLDSQSKMKTSTNTGRRVAVAKGQFAGNVWTDTSVDTYTAVNEVSKDNESDYFHLVINGLLKPLDCITSDGTIKKCISVARRCIDIVRSSLSPDSVTSPVTDNNEIVPDIGATSHMRKDRFIFEDDHVACNNVFVLMGDGTEIPVLGYGTSLMKIDRLVTRLINSLHVPGLDCDLFSCTRHGMMVKGCTFVLRDGKYT